MQQQQANTQQAAQQSTAGLQGAQTQQIQAGISAGLPQAEADFKNAQAQHEKVQTQYEQETNPLQKRMLEQNLENSQLDLQRKATLLKLLTSTQGPQMFDQQIDQIVPPNGENADLNQRTKVMAHAALQIGDLEGARKAVDSASNTITEMSKTKYVQNREDFRQALARQANQANNLQRNGLEQLDKMFTDPQHGYTQFLASANATKAAIQDSKNGNELASNLVPLMTVLGVNSFAGVHRINPIEYAQAGPELGSIYRRINAALDKAGSGSVPEDTLKEMNGLVSDLITAKHESLVPAARMVVANAGLDPKKTMIMGPDGKMKPLEGGAEAPATTGPKVGIIEGGYKFKGGDPANPNNWEKQ